MVSLDSKNVNGSKNLVVDVTVTLRKVKCGECGKVWMFNPMKHPRMIVCNNCGTAIYFDNDKIIAVHKEVPLCVVK